MCKGVTIMERHEGGCRICGEKDTVRRINLYYSGSEGLMICETCEMNLVEHVRGMVLIAGIARKAGYKACKEVRKAKEEQKEQAEKVVSGHTLNKEVMLGTEDRGPMGIFEGYEECKVVSGHEEREVCICSHDRIDHQYPDSVCRVVECKCTGFAMPLY